MMYLYGDTKRCLETITEAAVASLTEVKEILAWCRLNRDQANDTAEKEDALERALWRSCRDPVDDDKTTAWLATLPKSLSDTARELAMLARDTQSVGNTAGSSGSRVGLELGASGSLPSGEGGLETGDEEQGTGL